MGAWKCMERRHSMGRTKAVIVTSLRALSDDVLSWIMTAMASCYAVWSGYFLTYRVTAFGHLFAGLGAELPWATVT